MKSVRQIFRRRNREIADSFYFSVETRIITTTETKKKRIPMQQTTKTRGTFIITRIDTKTLKSQLINCFSLKIQLLCFNNQKKKL